MLVIIHDGQGSPYVRGPTAAANAAFRGADNSCLLTVSTGCLLRFLQNAGRVVLTLTGTVVQYEQVI